MTAAEHSFFDETDAGATQAPALDLGDVREAVLVAVRRLLDVSSRGRTASTVHHRIQVVRWLLDNDPCSQKELAGRLGISEAATSKLIQEMRIQFVHTLDALSSRCES